MTYSREGLAMNRPLIVATAAFLVLLPHFNNADAAGPYDGEWTGTATSTGERCKRAVVKLTVEGQVVLGQARFERDALNINGTVDEGGAFWASGSVNRVRMLATELVEYKPDVILAGSTPVAVALPHET